MEEEVKVAPTDTAVAPVADDLAKQLEAVKAAQAGSDRAYQEAAKKAAALEAEVEKLRKEKMSEKEKAEYEIARQKAEIEQQKREVAEATLHLSKVRIMGSKGVDLDYLEYITGNSEEEITKSIDTFNKRVDSLVAKRVAEKLGGTKAPESGKGNETPPPPEDWRELEKKWRGL